MKSPSPFTDYSQKWFEYDNIADQGRLIYPILGRLKRYKYTKDRDGWLLKSEIEDCGPFVIK